MSDPSDNMSEQLSDLTYCPTVNEPCRICMRLILNHRCLILVLFLNLTNLKVSFAEFKINVRMFRTFSLNKSLSNTCEKIKFVPVRT